MSDPKISRSSFLKGAGALVGASMLPMTLVELNCGPGTGSSRRKVGTEKFTFAFISDSHLTHIAGTRFVRNFDQGLRKAVDAVNFMIPAPDFVVYGGDLAQLGKREELDHGMEILSRLDSDIRFVIGEHDFYLDMGQYWAEKISKLQYSFDHKGVHFVTLNSILTYDEWIKKWPSQVEVMNQMARLDNPQGSPFMVGQKQIEWLKKDLEKVDTDTPIVVLSHSPLYKIFKDWNFWTDDAEDVQMALSRFTNVTVFHGHVHQVIYNQIKNISYYSLMSTAWPWPYPKTYSKNKTNYIPKMTVEMNRQDPFKERDGTGWSFINMDSGLEEAHYRLWENEDRTVKYDESAGHPVDLAYSEPSKRSLPQIHY